MYVIFKSCASLSAPFLVAQQFLVIDFPNDSISYGTCSHIENCQLEQAKPHGQM